MGRLQQILQSNGILNRKGLSVIIEVDIDDSEILTQPGNPLCPLVKLFVGVRTGVETFAAVKSDIGETTGSHQGTAKARHIKNTESHVVDS